MMVVAIQMVIYNNEPVALDTKITSKVFVQFVLPLIS